MVGPTLGDNSIRMKLKKHVGVVLEPSERNQFDSGASTFGCMFQDLNNDYYFYYTGSSDTTWRKACIGIAKSSDGVNFLKESKPAISVGRQSLTPTVFKAAGRYWMVFAFCTDILLRRRIGIAVADEPAGPWKFVKELAHATQSWEGDSIDIGASVARSGDNEYIVYYSNVIRGGIAQFLLGQHLPRQIGILKVTFAKRGEVIAEKWDKNPLAHLNGMSGTWNESLFCPGYLQLNGRHYLLPAASNYSMVNHPKQGIGIIQDSSPFFEKPSPMQTLLGSEEAKAVLPAESEIAFDSPSPLLRKNEIWLYYSIMDRTDGIWKTALSIMEA